MATDATGPVTVPDNIPTFLVGTDAPTGNGTNAMMAQLQAIISGLRDGTAPGGKIVASTALTATGTPDATTFLRGDNTWSAVTSAVPTGSLTMYGAAAAPTGWLLCDGSAVSRSTYATLFGVISTVYGVGDGTTTFNLPDLRGRMPVGFAAAGGHVDVSTLGNNDGSALANRRPKHKHVVPGGNNTSAPTSPPNFQGTSSSTGNVNIGNASTDPQDAPAYVVVNFIIKT